VQILLAALLATGMAAGEPVPCGAELFRVTRSTNANVVVYEARLSAPGKLDEGDPVHPVWLMLAEDGRREELNLVESAMAYGLDIRRDGGGEAIELAIRARPDLVIQVSLEAGCPVARTRIAGRDSTLKVVSVEASGGLFPEVAHVDLLGLDRATGTEVRERLLPDR
jgi:hypothetical protein